MRLLFNHPEGGDASRLHGRIFLYFTFGIVLTVMALSGALFVGFRRMALAQASSAAETRLRQASYASVLLGELARTIAIQLFGDDTARPLRLRVEQDVYELTAGLSRLDSLRNSTPYVQSIYLYNGRSDTFYISSPAVPNMVQNGSVKHDKDASSLSAESVSASPRPIVRRIYIPDPAYGSLSMEIVYSFVISDPIQSGGAALSRAVINISSDWLRDAVDRLDPDSGSDMTIVDAEGRVAFSRDETSVLEDVSTLPHIRRIFAGAETSGFFIEKVETERRLVTFVRAESMDWYFIRTVPYRLIVRSTAPLLYLIVLASASILVCGIALSFVVSGRLYQPIGEAFGRLQLLEADRAGKVRRLRDEFLRGLATGEGATAADAQSSGADEFELRFDLGAPLEPTLFLVDDYRGLRARLSGAELQALKNRIRAVILEAVGRGDQGGAFETVFLSEDEILAIGNPSAPGDPQILAAELGKRLPTTVSVVVGERSVAHPELPSAVADLRQAAAYRVFAGPGGVVLAAEVLPREGIAPVFSFDEERKLREAMLLEDGESSRNLADAILRTASAGSFSGFSLALTRLAFVLGSLAGELRADERAENGLSAHVFLEELFRLDDFERIRLRIRAYLDGILAAMARRRSCRHDQMVARAKRSIEADFADRNLCLAGIADGIGITASYLGKLYRDSCGESVPDAINRVRILHARELLDGSDESIQSIASKVGFSSDTYFFRVFKKAHGLTPTDYRRKQREGRTSH